MYHKSPMENYNKNNPFIIISKKTYDVFMDEIHIFSKDCIRMFIVNSLLAICAILLLMLNFVFNNVHLIYVITIIIGIVTLNALSYYKFRKMISYFISEHPAIVEFSRLSKLEVNDILSLNNEDLLKCLHGLYYAHGQLNTTRSYYFLSGPMHYATLLSSITIIVSIIHFVLFKII